MPAAMHLTVLVSLFAVAICSSSTSSSVAKQESSPSTAHPTSLTLTSKYDNTHSTHQILTEATSEKVSLSLHPTTSPQTPIRTEETQPSTPQRTTATNQTSNGTVSHGPTLPPASESPNITANATVNTTSPGLSHDWEKGDLAANPGLVAILCIFCIVVVLVLVVVTVKCIQSPRSNFERLEDVPMGKVNEESPFAHYSK